MATVTRSPTTVPAVDVQETMRGIVWTQFRRHPVALVAVATLGVVILASVFAFLSPYDPNQIDLTNRWASPSVSSTGSGPTSSAATCSRESSTAVGSRSRSGFWPWEDPS